MNIVKFLDIMKDGDEIYNSVLRNKFFYCINWKWVMPLEVNGHSTEEEYIEASKSDVEPASVECYLLEDYEDYIDGYATSKANAVERYINYNSMVPDEYTIDDLKNFRTLLATMLLSSKESWEDDYNASLTPKIDAMLSYYAGGMHDCAINGMSMFANYNMSSVAGTYTDCGCGSTTARTSLNTTAGGSTAMYASNCGCKTQNAVLSLQAACDCERLYRRSVHDFMVVIFSDYKFWELVSETVLPEAVKMLKGILQAGFTFSDGEVYSLLYGDCSCMSESADTTNITIISNLIKAFEMIMNGEALNNKNFIKSTLYAWAFRLYELMQW